MKYEKIPIAFSTDDNYAMPVSVAIKSIVVSTKEIKHFLFVILFKNKLSIKSKNLIKKAADINNNEILFIDVKNRIKNAYLPISHISESGYYRLALPELLSNYDKCLYLDGDIIAHNSIKDLLEIKLDDNDYIGAIKCESVQNSVITVKNRHKKELGINSLKQYINSGVLLMNLKKMREVDLSKKMIKLMENNYSIQDQDIFNVACFNHIKHLPLKYNAVPATFEKTILELSHVYSINEIISARKYPVIIHFNDKDKPWNSKNIKFGEEWDNYYKNLYGANCQKERLHNTNTYFERKLRIIESALLLIKRIIFG